jgi:hypothetical protein
MSARKQRFINLGTRIDCNAGGRGVAGSDPAAAPGDYVTVNVSYTFTPLFAGLSLVQQQDLPGMATQRLQ